MGQRLVLRVDRKYGAHKPLFCVYRHWGGFTESTYKTINAVYTALTEGNPYATPGDLGKIKYKDIISKLSKIGIFPIPDERKYINEKYGFNFDDKVGNRNDGIFAITAKHQNELFEAAESVAIMDLETLYCWNGCLWTTNMDEIKETHELKETPAPADIYEMAHNPEEFRADEALSLAEEVRRLTMRDYLAGVCRYEGSYYSLIM